MYTDLSLAGGIVLIALAFPSLLNAYSQSRFPRMALILFLAGAALVIYAVTTRPGGYALDEVPGVFIRVIGNVLN